MHVVLCTRKAASFSLIVSLSLILAPAMAYGNADVETLKASSWWPQVRNSIAQQEYEITWQPDIPGGGAFHAANRAQNLRCYFRDNGIEVIPRTGSIDWCWGFELVGFGGGDRFEYVDPVAPVSFCRPAGLGSLHSTWCVGSVGPASSERSSHMDVIGAPGAGSSRVEYVRRLMTEWYENGEEGLEQGFVIGSYMEESASRAPLVLEGRISGDLEALPADNGSHVSFLHGGVEVLRYGGLKVFDARGRELRSKLELDGDLLAIVIEDEGEFPIYVDPMLTSPSWTGESNQADAFYGYSVAGAGDVNNDGYSDVIVGALLYDNGQADEGMAFVYHGSPSGPSVSPDWTAETNDSSSQFGKCVAGAGDVNDDGYSDVIVTSSAGDAGRAYVYHGGSSGLQSTAAWIEDGEPDGLCFGRSAGCAGDVNNDGYSDIIIGDDCYGGLPMWEPGRAYVYHGGAAGLGASPAWTAA